MIQGSDFFVTTLTTAPFALQGEETASDRLLFTNVYVENNWVIFILHRCFQWHQDKCDNSFVIYGELRQIGITSFKSLFVSVNHFSTLNDGSL